MGRVIINEVMINNHINDGMGGFQSAFFITQGNEATKHSIKSIKWNKTED